MKKRRKSIKLTWGGVVVHINRGEEDRSILCAGLHLEVEFVTGLIAFTCGGGVWR